MAKTLRLRAPGRRDRRGRCAAQNRPERVGDALSAVRRDIAANAENGVVVGSLRLPQAPVSKPATAMTVQHGSAEALASLGRFDVRARGTTANAPLVPRRTSPRVLCPRSRSLVLDPTQKCAKKFQIVAAEFGAGWWGPLYSHQITG